MISLHELIQKYSSCKTKQNDYEIDNKKFIVFSHFAGNKDINEILTKLAIKQAYNEI